MSVLLTAGGLRAQTDPTCLASAERVQKEFLDTLFSARVLSLPLSSFYRPGKRVFEAYEESAHLTGRDPTAASRIEGLLVQWGVADGEGRFKPFPKLLSDLEVDPTKGTIAASSPLARSLKGLFQEVARRLVEDDRRQRVWAPHPFKDGWKIVAERSHGEEPVKFAEIPLFTRPSSIARIRVVDEEGEVRFQQEFTKVNEMDRELSRLMSLPLVSFGINSAKIIALLHPATSLYMCGYEVLRGLVSTGDQHPNYCQVAAYAVPLVSAAGIPLPKINPKLWTRGLAIQAANQSYWIESGAARWTADEFWNRVGPVVDLFVPAEHLESAKGISKIAFSLGPSIVAGGYAGRTMGAKRWVGATGGSVIGATLPIVGMGGMSLAYYCGETFYGEHRGPFRVSKAIAFTGDTTWNSGPYQFLLWTMTPWQPSIAVHAELVDFAQSSDDPVQKLRKGNVGGAGFSMLGNVLDLADPSAGIALLTISEKSAPPEVPHIEPAEEVSVKLAAGAENWGGPDLTSPSATEVIRASDEGDGKPPGGPPRRPRSHAATEPSSTRSETTAHIYPAGSIQRFLQEKLSQIHGNLGFSIQDFRGEPAIVPKLPIATLESLYEIARFHHQGQVRLDRDQTDYMAHVLATVAIYVDRFGIRDPNAIAAAFLHDVLEDSILYYRSESGLLPRDPRAARASREALAERRKKKGTRAIEAHIHLKLSGTELDPNEILSYVRAMTKSRGADVVGIYLPKIRRLGPQAVALKAADRMSNLADLRFGVPRDFVESEIFGKSAYDPGTIASFLEVPMAPGGASFLQDLPPKYSRIETEFKIQLLRTLGDCLRSGVLQGWEEPLNVASLISRVAPEVRAPILSYSRRSDVDASAIFRRAIELVEMNRHAWLEQRSSPRVQQYLNEENERTASAMRITLPDQKRLYGEMLSRIPPTSQSVPYLWNSYLYYSREEKTEGYPVYYRKRNRAGAKEHVLFDTNAMAGENAHYHLADFVVSPDNHLAAYAVDGNGSERYEIRIKNLVTGQDLSDRIENTNGDIVWAPNGQSLYYVAVDERERPYRLLRHSLGTNPATDLPLFEEADSIYDLDLDLSHSERFLLLGSEGSQENETWVLDLADPKGALKRIEPRRKGVLYSVEHQGDRLLIMTNDGAKDYRMMQAPLHAPGREHWTSLLPADPERVLEDFDVFENFLALFERVDGLSQIRIVDLRDQSTHEISFTEAGYEIKEGDNPDYHSTKLRFRYQSPLTPPSVYDYDMASRKQTLLKKADVPGGFNPARYTLTRTFAKASDGAQIPITLLRGKATMGRPGPLLLEGYGAYGDPLEGTFDPDLFSLLDRGVSYAIAHVRGGGEKGRDWYDGGRLLNKKNTFTDFIASAEHLIRSRVTRAGKIAIYGNSAGGLLVGAVTNLRPDLWGAVVAAVPFVDVVNTMSRPELPLVEIEREEWGDPRKKSVGEYIRSYSPYENVASQAYPPILALAGLNDPRVNFWEPVKWTAKIRELQTNDSPVLLQTEMGAGHQYAEDRYARLRTTAFRYAFILRALFHRPFGPPQSWGD